VPEGPSGDGPAKVAAAVGEAVAAVYRTESVHGSMSFRLLSQCPLLYLIKKYHMPKN
jgi:hypothetical protein